MKRINTVAELCAEFTRLAKQHELFLIEAPSNHYRPAPPEGYFGIRSNKRRLFLPLEDGQRYPHPDAMNALINTKNYIEHPL